MPKHTRHTLTDDQIRATLDRDELLATIVELRRLRAEHMGNAERAVGQGADRAAGLFLRNAAAYSDRLAVAHIRRAELDVVVVN